MYVCVCHAFTEKQVNRVLDRGTDTVSGVYRALGHTVQCGKCVPMVRDMVQGHAGAGCGACGGVGNCAHSAARAMPAAVNDILAAVAAE
ncbi:MAG TPA: (2Fe-2S)-binding protein [Azospirillaceae bacterium]|nr:(2Fe-2S)-binding protein [Azospirillaceae bacterium]